MSQVLAMARLHLQRPAGVRITKFWIEGRDATTIAREECERFRMPERALEALIRLGQFRVCGVPVGVRETEEAFRSAFDAAQARYA